jgi:hypothetical protein
VPNREYHQTKLGYLEPGQLQPLCIKPKSADNNKLPGNVVVCPAVAAEAAKTALHYCSVHRKPETSIAVAAAVL